MPMININDIAVVGTVTKKPELRVFTNSNGKETYVTTIRIGFKDKIESSKICFINVEIFGQKAIRTCENCEKGTLVYVRGSLRKRRYTNRDGQIRYNTDILCDTIRFVEGFFVSNIEISGYATRKPNLRDKNPGKKIVATVSVGYKDKRNYNDSYFIDTVIFGENARKFYESIDKGTPVYIKGYLHNNYYRTKDGQQRNTIELVVEEFQVIQINKNKYNNVDDLRKQEFKSIENNNVSLQGDNELNLSLNNNDIHGFTFIDDDDIPF